MASNKLLKLHLPINLCNENQTVLIIETVLISIMFLKLPLYWSYNRVIQKIFNTVLIIESVLIIETKEYLSGTVTT